MAAAHDHTHSLLSRIDEMVTDVNQVNGMNDKLERLAKYTDLKHFLALLMDPLQTTGVTSDQLKKYEAKTSKTTKPKTASESKKSRDETDLCQLLQKLYDRQYTGNEAKEVVLKFINRYQSHRDLLFKIFDKNLEIRMDIKQLNKAFPALISEFSVALANDFNKGQSSFTKSIKAGDRWWISRKYDGIRCLVKCCDGKVQAFSRNGHRLPALAPLEQSLEPFCAGVQFVLDGEVCVVDETGQESFASAVSNAKRKSVVMNNYRFYMFDMLTLEEFDQSQSVRTFGQRFQQLTHFVETVHSDNFRLVQQTEYSEESFAELSQQSHALGWEGLMLRRDAGYKGKRSNDLLKVKQFETEEYVVESIESGPMRMIDQASGLEVTVTTLKSVCIRHKGNLVGVGSGFSLAERHRFHANPNEIVGQTISVRYFEECQDSKTKQCSLRFPTFVCVHGEKRCL
jgi:DNA ligase-1